MASEASVLGWGLRPDTLRYVALAILFVTGVSDSTFLSRVTRTLKHQSKVVVGKFVVGNFFQCLQHASFKLIVNLTGV